MATPQQYSGFSGLPIRLLMAGIPAIVVLALYSPALFNGFVWDDGVTLPHLAYLSFDELRALVVAGSTLFSQNYFRPLPTLITVLESRNFDLFPVYFHLVNILLHATNTLLAYLVACQIYPGETARKYLFGLLVALLYGLHPALVEPVAWISGRGDLLVVLFLLSALWLDNLRTSAAIRIAGVSMLYLCALLSKEMAITFPVLLVLWHLAKNREPRQSLTEWWRNPHTRLELPVYAALFATTLIYFGLRFAVLGHILSAKGPSTKGILELSDRIWLVGASYAKFLESLSGPLTLQRPMHLLELPIGPTSNNAWLGLLVAGGTVGWLVLRRLKLSRQGWLWLTVPVSLLPISNFIPIQTGPGFFAERFLAFPLFFVSAAIVLSVESHVLKAVRYQKAISVVCIGIAGVWLAFCVVTVAQQIPRWQSDHTLWQWTVQAEPHSGYAHLQHIDTLKRQGNVDAGLLACQEGLRLAEPEYRADILRNLGFFHLEKNDIPAAIDELNAARRLYQDGNQNGIKFFGINMFGERQASGNPEYVIAINLGVAYSKIGNGPKALEEFENALQMEPQEPNAYYNIGQYHLDGGNYDNAVQFFEKALSLYKETRRGQSNKALASIHLQDAENKLQLAKTRLSAQPQK